MLSMASIDSLRHNMCLGKLPTVACAKSDSGNGTYVQQKLDTCEGDCRLSFLNMAGCKESVSFAKASSVILWKVHHTLYGQTL